MVPHNFSTRYIYKYIANIYLPTLTCAKSNAHWIVRISTQAIYEKIHEVVVLVDTSRLPFVNLPAAAAGSYYCIIEEAIDDILLVLDDTAVFDALDAAHNPPDR